MLNPSLAQPAMTQQPPQMPAEVYLLVGLIGAGKSTLATALESHDPRFRRICQDVLGDRKACEAAVKQAIRQGLCPIVDRQNFDCQQRSTWTKIAHQYNAKVNCLVLRQPLDVCQQRVVDRGTSHETIKDAQQGLRLLNEFAGRWQEPNQAEGFNKLVLLPNDLPKEYQHVDIKRVIDLLDTAPVLPIVAPPRYHQALRHFAPRNPIDEMTWRRPPPHQIPTSTQQTLEANFDGNPVVEQRW